MSGRLGSLSTAAIGLTSIMLFKAGGTFRAFLGGVASLLDILAILARASIMLIEIKRNFMMRKLMMGLTAATLFSLGSVQSYAADIVDTAVKAGQFNTLAAALKAADLIDTLKGKGPFTVFAPTDAAFAKLPAGTVGNLLKPENKAKLVQILTYHVVPGKIMSKSLAGKKTDAKTVEGSNISIDATMGSVMVNTAKVTSADVAADNGVIHVIDTVLIPKG
jgi:uncharacterized surface protein with fasciclin (FAS1) repeats